MGEELTRESVSDRGLDLLRWDPLAVAYVDALPEGLSAIYCYYDPTERVDTAEL